MTNRGRHKKPSINEYPVECRDLKDFNTFRKAFTVEQAKSLILNIRRFSLGKCSLASWEKRPTNYTYGMGFMWALSSEGQEYWRNLINNYEYFKNKSK